MPLLNTGNNPPLSDTGFPGVTEVCESFYDTLLNADKKNLNRVSQLRRAVGAEIDRIPVLDPEETEATDLNPDASDALSREVREEAEA